MRVSVWVAVVCSDSAKVLAARRASHTRNGGQWNFFGGGLDPGETPEQTALRELREEAGVTAPRSALTYLGDASFRGKQNHLYALPVAAEFAPSLNRESQDWRWFHMEELRSHRRLHAPTERLAPLLHHWIVESRGILENREIAKGREIDKGRMLADGHAANVGKSPALPPHLTWEWLLSHVPQVWPFRR